MILLDTNVISEPLRPLPDPRVVEWLRRSLAGGLFFTAIGIAELMRGAAILPDGKRKQQLAQDIQSAIEKFFAGRILSFDQPAAHAYAAIHGKLRENGRGIGVLDGQIAAIAKAHGAVIATRDMQPFLDSGLDVINPWAE